MYFVNLLLLTDLEGIPGIFDIDEIDRTSKNYAFARRKLTDHINCAVALCKKCGADDVYYLDGHAGGGNVFEEEIGDCAKKVTVADLAPLVKEKRIDCVLELGSHARAGTMGGFLDHTFNSKRIFEYRINGLLHSELSSHAVFFSSFGVPTVLCCGDRAACAQAKEYIPDIVTATVKTAKTRNICTPTENAQEIFENAVREALLRYDKISHYKIDGDITVSVTFYRTDMCEEALEKVKYPCVRTDARTLERVIPKGKLESLYQLVF